MEQNAAISFVKEIQSLGLTVPRLEISTLAGLNFVSAFDERPTSVMSNDSTAGVDFDPSVAVTKALVEYFERKVFAEGVANGDPKCVRRHSDGVASFPRSDAKAHQFARQNALCEAIERFVWAKWWDNPRIAFTQNPVESFDFARERELAVTLRQLRGHLNLESIDILEPSFSMGSEFKVFILLARVAGQGFLTGGAAGHRGAPREIFVRGLSELIRHGQALRRFQEQKLDPTTFYERRLLYFGLGSGNELVRQRLSRGHSTETIVLPRLEVDGVIVNSKFEFLIATHRCLFEDQPPFVDGELERLCL